MPSAGVLHILLPANWLKPTPLKRHKKHTHMPLWTLIESSVMALLKRMLGPLVNLC